MRVLRICTMTMTRSSTGLEEGVCIGRVRESVYGWCGPIGRIESGDEYLPTNTIDRSKRGWSVRRMMSRQSIMV